MRVEDEVVVGAALDDEEVVDVVRLGHDVVWRGWMRMGRPWESRFQMGTGVKPGHTYVVDPGMHW